MPSIALKLIKAPAEMPEGALGGRCGPLFRGNGDIDYVCGNCGFAIVSGFSANQHVISDTAACPACGATNEFPSELRA